MCNHWSYLVCTPSPANSCHASTLPLSSYLIPNQHGGTVAGAGHTSQFVALEIQSQWHTLCANSMCELSSTERIWPNGGSIRATHSMLGVNIWILLVRAKCQKWRNFTRKFGVTSIGLYIGLVLRGRVLDACLARSMRTCTGARVFASTPALISSQFLDLLRLTLVTDHE